MSAQVPAALKAADITRFAHRAAQLEKPKPILAYWCEYWIVNQILSKGLHNADQECLVYTTTLMDKLEQFKSEHADEPAVTDDVAGKAYVEQFGLETFERAENAVRANKASRQTADTFQASATFLDLLQIWGPVEPEISAKIKFAKYHALRIAKALKGGEDPNLSNPKPETPEEEALPPLDPNDADVQALKGGPGKPRQPSVVEIPDDADKIQKSLAQHSVLDESLHPSRDTSMPPPAKRERQPSVVEIPDEADGAQSKLAHQSITNESLHPSRAPSLPRSPANDVSPMAADEAAAFYTNQTERGDISPLEPPSDRKSSAGGNYFPRIPSPPASAPDLPSAPTAFGGQPPDLPSAPMTMDIDIDTDTDLDPPDLPAPPPDSSLASGRRDLAGLNQQFRHSPPPPPHRHGQFLPQAGPGQSPQIPPNLQPQVPQPQIPQNPPQLRQARGPVPPVPQAQPQPIHPRPVQPTLASASSPVNVNVGEVDDQAMMKAQKHARWAISALNFEDVPTAVRELREALAELGQR
ncbi:hypothetical protein H2202_002277 [Exophiala xenobiotica]|nr:hypothetical protein H2202_002277 [Exophiala xenobiotica]KAK5229997.1 hypothetical protein LTR72_001532 [Exophiala xenobiotica]KAK5234835.1 hypothetical protein LTR47_004281 [Exophiala xenobiotica]KAK5280766.1 hypothetical protein LTR40_005882 [Exophiala xenobiotica]KAK5295963.1 hypothetical protein LTR14_003594 [Exophiala xenobiotica]